MQKSHPHILKSATVLTIIVLALTAWLAAPFARVLAAEEGTDTFYARLTTADGKALTAKDSAITLDTNENVSDRVWQFTYNQDSESYTIANKATGLVLSSTGTGVAAEKASGANSQKWKLYLDLTNTFALAPVSDDTKRIDVSANSVTLGTNAAVFTITALSANELSAIKAPASAAKDTVKVVTAAPSTQTKSTQTQQSKQSSSDTQTTETVKATQVTNVDLGTSFTGYIKQISSGKVIGVNGSNVELQTTNTYKEQGWQFTRNSDGSYTITSLSNTSKALDIASGADKNWANVQVYTKNSTNAQKFFIREYSSGVYYLMPAVSTTKVLDLYNGRTKDGTNVQIYTKNGTAAQKFTIVKADASTFKTKTTATAKTTTTAATTSTVSKRQKVISIAQSQIGYKEGANNYTKYGVWYASIYGTKYGFANAPWCAMFVSWCGNQAGLSSDVFYYHAYTPSGVAWYQKKGLWHWKSNYTPKTGDIIYYDWNGDKTVEHVGLVETVKNGTVTTIEGNYSDQVKRRTISTNSSYIFGYASPNY